MDKANILMLVDKLTMDIGSMIYNTDKVLNNWKMDLSMKEIFDWERKMVMEHIIGLIYHHIQDNGKTTTSKVKENTLGQMSVNTKVDG